MNTETPTFYVTGRPLSEVGLENAEIIHADGRREPFTGFVAYPGMTMYEAVKKVIPEGAGMVIASDKENQK